jgi:hypothetical protein
MTRYLFLFIVLASIAAFGGNVFAQDAGTPATQEKPQSNEVKKADTTSAGDATKETRVKKHHKKHGDMKEKKQKDQTMGKEKSKDEKPPSETPSTK